jgi:DNA-binding response OmpR family regulator
MIEDDLFLSELVLTKLSAHGCIPYSTPNGEEGLVLAEQYSPHVIILDLMLPGIPGEEVLLKLKASETLKSIPVIVFSNKSGEDDIKNNLANGAAEYLVKSATDLRNLPSVILKVIQK